MASRNVMIGTGAALAGVGGLAVAAITANTPVEKTPTQVKTVAQPVETRTVVIRKVEHRVKRIKPKHPRVSHAAAAAPAPAPVVAQPAVVVQAAPVVRQVPVTPAITHPPPIRTRTSGGSGRGDDSGEHESHGGDDGAEHNDD